MQSNLQVVAEREIPDVQIVELPKMEEPSQPLSSNSPKSQSREMLEVMGEIRKILSARASAIMALIGSLALTFVAMEHATWMALAMAVSFDAFVFIPTAYIAYFKRA